MLASYCLPLHNMQCCNCSHVSYLLCYSTNTHVLNTNLVQMFLEPLCRLNPLPALHLHHDSEGFPSLVRAELVQQVVDVDEQQTQVLNLLRSARGIWTLHKQIQQVQEVHEERVIQLPELTTAIKMLRIQSFNALKIKQQCLYFFYAIAR